MSNEFGSRLKEIRQRVKMTQQQFGKKLGVNARGAIFACPFSITCRPKGSLYVFFLVLLLYN